MDALLKKPKRKMTEAQTKARLANLAKGRQKRMDMKKNKAEEFDLSSDYDSESDTDSSDEEAFVISKKKKSSPKKTKDKRQKNQGIVDTVIEDPLRKEFVELKSIVLDMAKKQYKASKTAKRTQRASGGTSLTTK